MSVTAIIICRRDALISEKITLNYPSALAQGAMADVCSTLSRSFVLNYVRIVVLNKNHTFTTSTVIKRAGKCNIAVSYKVSNRLRMRG